MNRIEAVDVERARAKSMVVAAELGIVVPATLPYIDPPRQIRTAEEITSRALAMQAAGASAYRFPQAKALSWTEREGLFGYLTPSESEFLSTGIGDRNRLQGQIEGIWALAWVLTIVEALDFTTECDNTFYKLLPNLTTLESSEAFRRRVRMRPLQEIVQRVDTAYCLHWAIRNAELRDAKLPRSLDPVVVIERRRALEWVITPDTSWDDISLDT